MINVQDLLEKVFDSRRSEGERLSYALKLLENEYCPFDCDNCHSDTCPCDRLGCAGAK